MASRKDFLKTSATLASATTASAFAPFSLSRKDSNLREYDHHTGPGFRTPQRIGMGGVGAGNGFHKNSDEQIRRTMEAAWDAGVRYFDTSPWYGLGLSERRMGHFLYNKNREDYLLSSKVGRILMPDEDAPNPQIWHGKMTFNYEYDYSAEATRRSVESSLQRLGVSSLDIVFIHDLSPDNGDFDGDGWLDYFEQAQSGAMPELTKMREEGLIKAWGMGVNTIEPIMKCMEVADPDVMLSATQYHLLRHQDSLDTLFPACRENDVSIVIGAPLAAGFLAGKDRYLYSGTIPDGFPEKREQMNDIARNHGIDLRTAALQFSAAPEVVTAVIPGASRAYQPVENTISMHIHIPDDFWEEMKQAGLISKDAPTPSSTK